MEGWVKLHRKLISWEWFNDSKMVHLFMYLLLSANHKDNKWQGKTIKRGQLITGRIQISAATGISQQSVRTCLRKLEDSNIVTIKSTNKNSVITIVNYNNYQINESTNQQSTNETTSNQPATNQQSTTNKNDNNKKNEKEVEEIPTLEDFISHAVSKVYNIDKTAVKLKYEAWVENGWKDGNGNKVKNWKSKLSNTLIHLPKSKNTGGVNLSEFY